MAFLFGSPEDTAQMYIDSVAGMQGPPLPEGHYQELSEPEVRTIMVHLWRALRGAIQDGAHEDVIAIIGEDYSEIVLYLADISPRFKNKVLEDEIVFPGGPEMNERFKELLAEDLED